MRKSGARAGGKRYEQVAEALIADIRTGRLSIGTTLPGELELVERFGVSRHTVREALRRLDELGLIDRHQGVGTTVRARQPTPSYTQTVRSPAELLQYPVESRLGVVRTEPVRANRKLARLLGCPVGSQWVKVSCVRRFKESRAPICWVDIYLVPEYAPVADVIGRRQQLVAELIEQRFGEKVMAVDIDIMARTVPEEIAAALEVAPGAPTLTVVRRYTGQNRRLFQATVSEHPGDRYTYSLHLRRGWQAGAGSGWSTG